MTPWARLTAALTLGCVFAWSLRPAAPVEQIVDPEVERWLTASSRAFASGQGSEAVPRRAPPSAPTNAAAISTR